MGEDKQMMRQEDLTISLRTETMFYSYFYLCLPWHLEQGLDATEDHNYIAKVCSTCPFIN